MELVRTLFVLTPLAVLAAPVGAQWSTAKLSEARWNLAAVTIGTKAILSEDRFAMIAVVAAGGPIDSNLAAQNEFVRTCQIYHPPGPGCLTA